MTTGPFVELPKVFFGTYPDDFFLCKYDDGFYLSTKAVIETSMRILNDARSGFKLMAENSSTGSDVSGVYVLDPRGFSTILSMSNVNLLILCGKIINGEIIGECRWATDLEGKFFLVPVGTPFQAELTRDRSKVRKPVAGDLVTLVNNNDQYVYMGEFTLVVIDKVNAPEVVEDYALLWNSTSELVLEMPLDQLAKNVYHASKPETPYIPQVNDVLVHRQTEKNKFIRWAVKSGSSLQIMEIIDEHIPLSEYLGSKYQLEDEANARNVKIRNSKNENHVIPSFIFSGFSPKNPLQVAVHKIKLAVDGSVIVV